MAELRTELAVAAARDEDQRALLRTVLSGAQQRVNERLTQPIPQLSTSDRRGDPPLASESGAPIEIAPDAPEAQILETSVVKLLELAEEKMNLKELQAPQPAAHTLEMHVSPQHIM